MGRLARWLHARGYTVVAYDTRGQGDSDWDPTGQYDVERLASDLLAVRERFADDRPPAVVGASLGGMTILAAPPVASQQSLSVRTKSSSVIARNRVIRERQWRNDVAQG